MNAAADPAPARFLTGPETDRLVGLSKTERYRRIAAGTFPKPIHLGPHSPRWCEAEVVAWMNEQRARARGTA
ncbi:helix-turn-helix transcriptional regulator [Luteimonas saliphila]|uniref:helix-turn-helix transcriptional regulator n=1 Tax=Luteimonas saliphila TaxID=2804919 RepID=UPI00192DC9AE|nr:AlpA family phage regulatory protein [Luteimonas saliphila]